VTAATRAAVAGCLWALAESPEACAAMSDRLVASRLAALVARTMGEAAAAGGAWGSAWAFTRAALPQMCVPI
jgi:hypothetical protein